MRDHFREPLKYVDSQATRGEHGSTYATVTALAADLGLSERSTRAALRRGEIPHIRIGRRFILPKAAIAEWLRTAARAGDAEGTAVGHFNLTRVALSGQTEVPVMRPTKLAGR